MQRPEKTHSPALPAVSPDLLRLLEVVVHGIARPGLRNEADIGEFTVDRNSAHETTITIPLPRFREDKSVFCEAVANVRYLMPRVAAEEDLLHLQHHPGQRDHITLFAHSPSIMTQALEFLGKAIEQSHPEIDLKTEDRELALHYLRQHRASLPGQQRA